MGLAASQARLLTITARLADNELRSQTINNAKMRLATQSAQASEKYVNALNQSDMMFQNTMLDGTSQNQLLTFNSLTAYSPYNTQYGLVNAAGLALVSEADANMFVASGGNCEKFLKLHGLEWQSTYFDHVNKDELKAALGDDYGAIYDSITANDYKRYSPQPTDLVSYLRAIYEHYDAYEGSLEYATFRTASQGFLSELKSSSTRYETWILGAHEDENGGRLSTATVINNILDNFKYNANPNYCTQVSSLSDNGADAKRKAFLDSANDEWTDLSKEFFAYILLNVSDDFINYWQNDNLAGVIKGILGLNNMEIASSNNYYYLNGDQRNSVFTISDTDLTYNFPPEDGESPKSITFVKDGDEYKINSCVGLTKSEDGKYAYIDDGDNREIYTISNNLLIASYGYKDAMEAYSDALGSMLYGLINCPTVYMSWNARSGSYMNDLLSVVFGEPENGNPWENINKFADLLGVSDFDRTSDEKLSTVFMNMRKLADIEEMMKLFYNADGSLKNSAITPSKEFKNLMDMYRVDALVFLYGEPKYAWVDTKDTGNTGNPDTKAQWLTNLFERMKKGYRVLEDGLASSNDWIEYALQSGLVTLEQVDSSNRWINIDYKTCAGITEQTDRSAAVAKAEAEYNRAMNDIKQKDSIFDLQLKNIDTEHASLQQEYDSIQKVINKNIERTMKFDQNG